MREFLNIRGCLTHILALNQSLMLSPRSPRSRRGDLFQARSHILLLLRSPDRNTWHGTGSCHREYRYPKTCHSQSQCLQLGCKQRICDYGRMPFLASSCFSVKLLRVPSPTGIPVSQPVFPWMEITSRDAENDIEESGTRK